MGIHHHGRSGRVGAVLATAGITVLALTASPASAGASTVAGRSAATAAVSQVNSPAVWVGGPLKHRMAGVKWQSYSTNWSGYAVNGDFTDAIATWIVPTVIPTADDRVTSDWVGIDGVTNGTVIQTGTEEDSIGGQPVYSAWWENYPVNAAQKLNLTIHPGDTITARVYGNDSGLTSWTTVLTDDTTGQSASGGGRYSGLHDSAEFIQEAATTINGSSALPTDLTATSFSNLLVTPYNPNGSTAQNPNLTTADEIFLSQNNVIYYTPSDPVGGNSFTVSYTGT